MNGSCKTAERSRPLPSQIWAHFVKIGSQSSSEGKWRDSNERTSDATASLATFDCVAAWRARSSAAALLAPSNSAARLSSSARRSPSFTALWDARPAICFVEKRGLDDRNRDKNERCFGARMLGDSEGTGDEGEVVMGDGDGRVEEEEEGLCEEGDDELEILDPLGWCSSASKRWVSTIGSGRGGSGRRGDFKGPGSRGWAAVAR